MNTSTKVSRMQRRLITLHWARVSLNDSQFAKNTTALFTAVAGVVQQFSATASYPKGDHVLQVSKQAVRAAVISNDGTLFTGDDDGWITQWDLYSSSLKHFGNHIAKWEAHCGRVRCLSIGPGLILASAGDSCRIRIWDNKLQCTVILEGHTKPVLNIAIHSRGLSLVSGSEDHSVCLWSIRSGLLLRTFTEHTGIINDLIFESDELVISASEDQCLKLWNPDRLRSICTLKNKDDLNVIYSLSLNSDHSKMAASDDNNHLVIWNWPQMKKSWNTQSFRIGLIRFHPLIPNYLALSDSEMNIVVLLDVESGEFLRMCKGHSSKLYDVCFSSDGLRMVSVSDDGSARVWDLSSLSV